MNERLTLCLQLLSTQAVKQSGIINVYPSEPRRKVRSGLPKTLLIDSGVVCSSLIERLKPKSVNNDGGAVQVIAFGCCP